MSGGSVAELIGWRAQPRVEGSDFCVWVDGDGGVLHGVEQPDVDHLLAWLRLQRVYPTITVGTSGCTVQLWRTGVLARVEPFEHTAASLLEALEQAVRAVAG